MRGRWMYVCDVLDQPNRSGDYTVCENKLVAKASLSSESLGNHFK